MAFENQFTRLLDRLDVLPGGLSTRAFSIAFGAMVPYVSTSGIRIESVSEQHVVATIKNRRKVRNHVGGVHAAAIALLAETTSGIIVGRNVPDSALPLIKSMSFKYIKRNYGAFRAEASLSAEQVEQIRNQPKGNTVVPVTLEDGRGNESVSCEMVWAWVPKKT